LESALLHPLLKNVTPGTSEWFEAQRLMLSGGVNLRTFFPRFLTKAVAAADWILQPLDPVFAIHWHLTIRKD